MGNNPPKKKRLNYLKNNPSPLQANKQSKEILTTPEKKTDIPVVTSLIPSDFVGYKEKSLLKKEREIILDEGLFYEELQESMSFINKFLLFKYTTANV